MENNKCCACEYKIRNDSEFLHFRRCLNEHGRCAHRVCKNCWFKIIVPISEEVHLRCLGCTKKLPLVRFQKKKPITKSAQIIDIDD